MNIEAIKRLCPEFAHYVHLITEMDYSIEPYKAMAILQALAEARQAMEWRPIESAPKDGTKVDLWVVHSDGERRIPDCLWVDTEEVGGDWVFQYGWAVYSVNGTPTHFKIPTPPSGKEG